MNKADLNMVFLKCYSCDFICKRKLMENIDEVTQTGLCPTCSKLLELDEDK